MLTTVADPTMFYGKEEGHRRTCFRCGAEFFAPVPRRVCNRCRKQRKSVERKKPEPGQRLSFREWQVTHLVSLGKENKEIAWELGLTEGTIKEYINRIFHKTGLDNRTRLARWMWLGGDRQAPARFQAAV